MTPVDFPESNNKAVPPPDFEESQVATIPCWGGYIQGGNLDGSPALVVAWQPDEEDLTRLVAGAPVYLTVLGRLPPHYVSTSFDKALLK